MTASEIAPQVWCLDCDEAGFIKRTDTPCDCALGKTMNNHRAVRAIIEQESRGE